MKKQHLAILSATFLLVIVLITQNVFATSVDSSGGTSMASSKYVDVTGSSLSTSDASKVHSLLNSIKKTEGFVVYANNIDRTNHIEGNVCVSSVTTTTTHKTVEKPVFPKTGDNTLVIINIVVVLVGIAITIVAILFIKKKK